MAHVFQSVIWCHGRQDKRAYLFLVDVFQSVVWCQGGQDKETYLFVADFFPELGMVSGRAGCENIFAQG